MPNYLFNKTDIPNYFFILLVINIFISTIFTGTFAKYLNDLDNKTNESKTVQGLSIIISITSGFFMFFIIVNLLSRKARGLS